MGVAISSILEFVLKDRDRHECKVNRAGSRVQGMHSIPTDQRPGANDVGDAPSLLVVEAQHAWAVDWDAGRGLRRLEAATAKTANSPEDCGESEVVVTQIRLSLRGRKPSCR